MGTLTGKYAIVTGSGKGIGASIVKRFLQEDIAGVAMFEWDEELCKKTAAELDPTGEKLLVVKCDISNEEMVKAGVEKTLEKFGTIDILVNNAGITKDRMFHKMSTEDWMAVINVNLNGTFFMCKYVVPILRDKEYGRIVNISSTSSYGTVGQANYSATKGAINSFTKTLAKELIRKGVTVNAIAPGHIHTDMYDAIPEEARLKKIAGLPMGRLGEPEEIASAVNFLSGPDCAYITGKVLFVDGGSRDLN